MSLYGTSKIVSVDETVNNDDLMRLYLLDDVMNESSETLEEFCNSEEFGIMCEKVALDKKIVDKATVRKMDLNRRKKLACYQLAKEMNDHNWTMLVKFSALKKKYAMAILAKYSPKADRIAKISQKEYIKKTRGAAAK